LIILISQPRHQRTIARSVTVNGFGYWSSVDISVEFRPAPAWTGIVFVRKDLSPAVRIPVGTSHRIEIPRRTVLNTAGGRVEMIEHVLAALAGLQIDNCEVWIDGEELPGMDGSSREYVEALDWAGLTILDAPREQIVIREPISIGDENSWIEARPSNEPNLTLRYELDYPNHPEIGRQTLQLVISPRNFREQLCKARTFMLREEADWIIAQGLGQRATFKDLLIFDKDGVVDNTLNYADECVRHKMPRSHHGTSKWSSPQREHG
jgi:UDP-3-O-[3-hydroxymyristoyl] N-acetylglucosamine deacetylase